MAVLVHPRAWIEARRARREADYWIRRGFESRYRWRVAELTKRGERKVLARSLRGVLGELNGSLLPGVTPLRTAAVRPYFATVALIEQRLLDDRPVSAQGILGVNDLLTSPGSCLFSEVDDVEACLRAVLEDLEVH